ncbi:MAG: hypothetical protein ACHQT8_06345 [Chlamydiales bacterium]
MSRPTSFSSDALSSLLEWRNPNGGEENWYQGRGQQRIDSYATHITKVALTECALPFLATAAIVETVFFTAIALVSLIPGCVNEGFLRIFRSSLGIANSAGFTTAWSLANFLIFNLFDTNVFTKEFFARSAVGIATLRDEIDIVAWERQYPVSNTRLDEGGASVQLQPVRGTQVAPPANGAKFITEDITPDLQDETRQLIIDWEPNVFEFIIAKTIFIYAVGARSKEEIPSFFLQKTRENILALRKERTDADAPVKQEGLTEAQITKVLESREAFSTHVIHQVAQVFKDWDRDLAAAKLKDQRRTKEDSCDYLQLASKPRIHYDVAQKLFSRLAQAGAEELQGAFITTHLGEAIELLKKTR